MPRWSLVLWTFLAWWSGCASGPVYGPAYASTAPVCGWRPTPPTVDALTPTPVSELCAARIADDLAIADGLDPGVLERLLGAVAALGSADLGVIGDAPEPLDEVLAPVVAATGETEVEALVYDYVVGHVAETVPGEDPTVWATFDQAARVLAVTDLPGGIDGAAILLHEARHGDGVDHVPCEDLADAFCDRGGGGAYDAQRAFHELVWSVAQDDLLADDQITWIAQCERRIEG